MKRLRGIVLLSQSARRGSPFGLCLRNCRAWAPATSSCPVGTLRLPTTGVGGGHLLLNQKLAFSTSSAAEASGGETAADVEKELPITEMLKRAEASQSHGAAEASNSPRGEGGQKPAPDPCPASDVPAATLEHEQDVKTLPLFKYRYRFMYTFLFRSKELSDFIVSNNRQILSVAQTYRHAVHQDIVVTLIPLSHAAHPHYFYQVDLLCCQHDSVLMEGRVPFELAPYSTLVPPRPLHEFTGGLVRIAEEDEGDHGPRNGSCGWEPRDMAGFWQPFSWGVKDSPNYTVIHAADKYDYERLPWYASVRFNAPLLGSLAREKHCLDMLPGLIKNGYKKFAIPWGASHMPIFAEMLEQNGFVLVSASSLVVFDEDDGIISSGYVRSIARRIRLAEYRDELLMGAGAVAAMSLILSQFMSVEWSGATLKEYAAADARRASS